MIFIYFSAAFWNLKKIFTQKIWGQIIVGCAYLLILGFLFLAVFLLGKSSFQFLYTFGEISKSLIRYILLTALALACVFSILSFLIALSQRLFEKKLAAFYTTGHNPMSIFQAVFWENFLIGGWPFVVLALPLLLAYLFVSHASIIFTPFLLLLLALLAVLTESAGAILALLFRYYFGKISQKLIYLFTLLTFLTLAVSLKYFFLPSGLPKIAQRPTLPEVFSGLAGLPIANPYLPTSLFLDSLSGNFYSLLVFVSITALLYLITLKLAKSFYRPAWQKAQEGLFLAGGVLKITGHKKASNFHGRLIGILEKDQLIFERSLSSLLYFSFIIFLAVVYLFLLAQSPRHPEFSPSIFPKIAAFTIMIIGYLITMVSLRFSFPSLVSEFSSFWLLARLPNGRRQIFKAKWIAQTFFVVSIAWILGILATFILALPLETFPYFLGLILSLAIIISAVNLFIGGFWATLLPRQDIEQTTTAFPAVAATLISVIFAAALGIFFYRMIQISSNAELILLHPELQNFRLGAILIFSLGFWFSLFYLGFKKFRRIDIR